jgi:hypothetical protein
MTMEDIKLGSVLGISEEGQDVRVSLRNKDYNRNLKMTVVGYNITEKGNITLQAVKNDKVETLTMFPEEGIDVKATDLDKLINKLIIVDNVQKNQTKDTYGKVLSVSMRCLYIKSNIKIVSEYPNAFENGVFALFYPMEEFLTLRSFEEKEFRVGTNEKTKKPVMRKAYVATMKDMMGSKLVLKKVLLINENKEQLKTMIGKKIKFTETEKVKNKDESFYISYDLPEIEGVKKEAPKPESK